MAEFISQAFGGSDADFRDGIVQGPAFPTGNRLDSKIPAFGGAAGDLRAVTAKLALVLVDLAHEPRVNLRPLLAESSPSQHPLKLSFARRAIELPVPCLRVNIP
jgi:hypothetical protein